LFSSTYQKNKLNCKVTNLSSDTYIKFQKDGKHKNESDVKTYTAPTFKESFLSLSHLPYYPYRHKDISRSTYDACRHGAHKAVVNHGVGKEDNTNGGCTIHHAMGKHGWPAALGLQGDIGE
jgi:hypothetical protein